jgi:hypothetical protein
MYLNKISVSLKCVICGASAIFFTQHQFDNPDMAIGLLGE